jgi:hypothetical protein
LGLAEPKQEAAKREDMGLHSRCPKATQTSSASLNKKRRYRLIITLLYFESYTLLFGFCVAGSNDQSYTNNAHN